ncbi:50S ribosomal protein L18 [candidate division bacterium WOR-3 4484_18]|uniref:Large ribosomal subunit protein uL18 n=1 Tax=candidate division WOR-3 bacterium 4484_18 TaxID=2020626 RepID=A0A257LVK8_UNCW3|nr:MAG: 50S ribosomal protein L18 [candidate division bacterium WOR-3 4484_18]
MKRLVGREKRHKRIRRKVSGTPERPRLCVFRSLKHIYVQMIDDTIGHTLVAASTLEIPKEQLAGKTKVEQAYMVGKLIAEKALKKGITKVVFDRGGYKYHGRVKALAEGAREGGLLF